MKVLAADIGGTSSRLCVAATGSGKPVLSGLRRFVSSDYGDLRDILGEYAAGLDGPVDAVSIAIAGPVRDGRCRTTNLPWDVNIDSLVQAFGWSQGFLLNDLEAVGRGIDLLDETDIAVINEGKPDEGNAAILAAGTGLGQAGLFRDADRYRPFATEGGHADFAPENATEYALRDWLAGRYGHVSWERLVSGMGIADIYRFLLEHRQQVMPESFKMQDDLAEAVTTAALSGSDTLCVETLDMFVSLLGREAGNLALKFLTRGGVYLAGGIPPKLLDRLRRGDFFEAFCAKGRMASLMRDIPVRVVLDDNVALYGAARYAQRDS